MQKYDETTVIVLKKRNKIETYAEIYLLVEFFLLEPDLGCTWKYFWNDSMLQDFNEAGKISR